MDKRPVAIAEPSQSRAARRDFMLAAGARKGLREAPFRAAVLAQAVRRSADAAVDEEILAWIASHVPADKRRKTSLT
jgi:hypothetical protein